jgi:hypothetical protein
VRQNAKLNILIALMFARMGQQPFLMPRIRTDIVSVEIWQNCCAAQIIAFVVGALNVNGFRQSGHGSVMNVGRNPRIITLLLGVLQNLSLRASACIVSVHCVSHIMPIAVVAAAVYASTARASRTCENVLSPLSAVLAWGSKITLQYAKK